MKYNGLSIESGQHWIIISTPQKKILIPTVRKWTNTEIKKFVDENEKEIKEENHDAE